MPKLQYGQAITFAVDQNADETYTRYIWIRAIANGDTIQRIASRRGHPEQAHDIARLNHIRNVRMPLKKGRLLRLPGTLKAGDVIHVLADDPPPIIKDGYATYDVLDAPGRKGINRFKGYNPVAMDVPINFEHFIGGDGRVIERDILTLERMAGRGRFPGAAVGPPAVLRLSCTDNNGAVVPLIPSNYQWSPGNPNAPRWRINGINWDQDPQRHLSGRRTRQKAVVTVWEYTPIIVTTRSAAQRSVERVTKRRQVRAA